MKGVVERLAGLADLLLAKAAPPTWEEKVWPDDLWAPQSPAGGVLPPAPPAGSPFYEAQTIISVVLRRSGCQWPNSLARIVVDDLSQHFTWTRK